MADEKQSKSKAKPKIKVWLVKALRNQKACFETGDGKRTEYDFKVKGHKNPDGTVCSGIYRIANFEHVEKLSHPDNKAIEVYDTNEV